MNLTRGRFCRPLTEFGFVPRDKPLEPGEFQPGEDDDRQKKDRRNDQPDRGSAERREEHGDKDREERRHDRHPDRGAAVLRQLVAKRLDPQPQPSQLLPPRSFPFGTIDSGRFRLHVLRVHKTCSLNENLIANLGTPKPERRFPRTDAFVRYCNRSGSRFHVGRARRSTSARPATSFPARPKRSKSVDAPSDSRIEPILEPIDSPTRLKLHQYILYSYNIFTQHDRLKIPDAPIRFQRRTLLTRPTRSDHDRERHDATGAADGERPRASGGGTNESATKHASSTDPRDRDFRLPRARFNDDLTSPSPIGRRSRGKGARNIGRRIDIDL